MSISSDTIDDFVGEAVKQALLLIDAKDAAGAFLTKDPRMLASCRSAYIQLEQYCNRMFIRNTYHQETESQNQEELILLAPSVQSITSVTADDIAKVVTTDWVLNTTKNQIEFTADFNLYNTVYALVRTVYVAGYDAVEDNSILLDSVVQQGIANYKRIATLGIRQMTGPAGQGTLASDSGSVIASVKGMIQPLVYYGPDRLWRLPE